MQGEPSSRPVPPHRTNRALALGLLGVTALLALSIWTSDWAHDEVRDGFLLGGFPLFALAMIALSLVVMLFDGEAGKSTDEMLALRWYHVAVALAAAGVLGGTFWLIGIIGFVLAIFALITGGALVLQFRPVWLAVTVGLGASVLLRVLLLALDVRIEDGPLSGVFGG